MAELCSAYPMTKRFAFHQFAGPVLQMTGTIFTCLDFLLKIGTFLGTVAIGMVS